MNLEEATLPVFLSQSDLNEGDLGKIERFIKKKKEKERMSMGRHNGIEDQSRIITISGFI